MSCPFIVGKQYTRDNIYEIMQVPHNQRRGNWETGYTRWNDDWFIFVTLTHVIEEYNYGDHWNGEELVWHGKRSSHLRQGSIKSLLTPPGNIYVFTRDQVRTPFRFAGCGTAKQALNTVPVTIIWNFPNE